ncbi:MAG: hypothetical protein R2939_18670 [Kofleriaceae bacterium]
MLGDGARDGRFGFGGFVLTRLHARYGTELTEDLVAQAAPPIVGGREFVVDGGKLEERSRPASTNNFQARYAIRHAWTGAVACKDPKRGRWGGPPAGVEIGDGGPTSAGKTAFAPRGPSSWQPGGLRHPRARHQGRLGSIGDRAARGQRRLGGGAATGRAGGEEGLRLPGHRRRRRRRRRPARRRRVARARKAQARRAPRVTRARYGRIQKVSVCARSGAVGGSPTSRQLIDACTPSSRR